MKQKQVIIILYIIVLVMIILPVGILIHWLFFKSGIKFNFNTQNQQEVTNEYIYDFDKSEYIFASTQNEWFELSKNGKWYDVRFNGGDVDTDVIQQFIEAGKCNEGGKEMTLSAGSITITDDGLVVISGDRCICYLDVVNKKIIKILPLEHRDTVAVNIGDRDILFFDGGNLYKYEFDSDNKILLYETKLYKFEISGKDLYKDYPYDYGKEDGGNYIFISNSTAEYPYPYARPVHIAYSKKYNSIYYKTRISLSDGLKTAVVSMSLDDFTIYVVCLDGEFNTDLGGNVFYTQKNALFRHDGDTRKSEKIFEHDETISWFKLFNDAIFFMQKSSPNIKGVKFPEFRVYHQNKVKYVKINANIYRNCWDIIKN
ncbi:MULTISPECIES: hypothetical protein [Treponema]|uniref:DUF5050 domain-containing protein n=1 Tax=Treponema denticola (strain ATCC 35405 / DSM 14222 / CIP 103919 / JCM 8153 / KCTC 15104) TaxID=243275 RepID=Q73QY3_TREDE|nr:MULTISPECIES: hypothetical protein [Treponema]AAS10805.1 hypothetical protein TDE_0310 [Treponema denticola ATCC 35405]EMB36320.1 hypothetical protein HMPREF9721_01726 [Treponema denticola ATCC 35404]EMB41095.1 hypothetical protein HMPREF9735_00109 [Treponema denticola ATCC 33521]HCY95622.1 hypothetical protein [Treponema sp.]